MTLTPRADAVPPRRKRLIRAAVLMATLLVTACSGDAPSGVRQQSTQAPVASVTPAAITFVAPPDTSGGGKKLASGDSLGSVIIQVVTAAGTPVPAANSVVHATLQGTTGGPWVGASIVGSDSVITDSEGRAALGSLVIKGKAGSSGRLVLSSGSLVAASIPIQLSVGKASPGSSAMTLLPDSIPVGGISQLVIALLDDAGNRLGSGEAVTAALSGGTATATISAITFNTADSTYRASVTGNTSGTRLTLTAFVTGQAIATRSLTVFTPVPPPVPATSVAITTLPGDTTSGIVARSGSPLSATAVALRDANGGAVRQAGVPVTATLTSVSGGTLGGSQLTGGGAVSTAVDGTVTFPALTVTGIAGAARIQFSAPGLTSASFPIRIAAGGVNASTSTMTSSPDSVTVGAAAQLVIVPKDAQGNKPGDGLTVSVAASGGTAAGSVGAVTYQTSDSSYRASFTGTTVGTPLTLRATVSSIALSQTRTISVVAGAVSASSTTLTTSADSIVVNGGATIVVIPRDASGAKKGAGLSVTVDASGGTSAGRISAITYVAGDSSYRTSFVAQTAGTATAIRATVNGVQASASRSLTVLAAPPQTWTYCSATGTICEFTGRRDVRLVASNGATYTQTFYANVPCAANGYNPGFTGTPSGSWVRCEYGDQQYDQLDNPNVGLAGLTATTLLVPRGDDGVSVINTASTGESPSAPLGEGSFRMTCKMTKMGFFDPIVYPGAANSAHLHMFFGNTAISPGSTSASLTSTGGGSCIGGTVNRTGYWVPAVFDSRTSQVITPDFATIYYKTGYNVDPATVNEIPAGLVMIAGDKSSGAGVQIANKLEIAVWACETANRANNGAVASCPVGDKALLIISFPQCWDGVNLDSPDHKSHMAYPVYRDPPARSTCPTTHPVMLPIISEIFHWKVTSGMDTNYWRLASDTYSTSIRGGYSAHADWMNGWTPEYFRAIVRNCLNPGRDCFVGLLGDGRELR